MKIYYKLTIVDNYKYSDNISLNEISYCYSDDFKASIYDEVLFLNKKTQTVMFKNRFEKLKS